jgi:CHAT domain
VRRIAPERDLAPATLPNDPALPIQLFRYREVAWHGSTPTVGVGAGFAREEAFLASLSDVTVDGPWPTDEAEADVKQRVIDALFDANQRLTPVTGQHPAAALAHFACHWTVKQHSEEFELLLSTQSGEPRKVTMADITAGYSARGESRYPDRPERAAVIFNACGTSTIDPLSSLSFQRWFLTNRHPAFLGTQAAIPDEIAADFAELLYGFLLGGFSFGKAVVLARRQLLIAAKSPLGILYFLHGTELSHFRRWRRPRLPGLPGFLEGSA